MSGHASYLRPRVAQPDPPAPFPIPRSLAPLSVPPTTARAPSCPPSRGPVSELPGWSRSSHIFPAAYPRVPTLPQPVGQIAIGELHRRRAEHYDGRPARLEARAEVLWTVAERWARVDATGNGVTLLCTHPNGMHKEVCSPRFSTASANALTDMGRNLAQSFAQ